jgi:hypothetical protein
MVGEDRVPSLEEAFERIEGTILPTISMMLDTLLDAASLAQPGIDSTVYAAELRTVALQLEDLTRQVEAMSPVRPVPYAAAPARMSA